MLKTKYPLIRTIYLYLFALIGLVMVTIGAAKLIDVGLKTYIFTKADVENTVSYYPRPTFPDDVELVETLVDNKESLQLTTEQARYLDQWIEEYKEWQEKAEIEKVDYVTQRRHQDVSSALSLIIVGLPLYLYHWSVIKKDIKEKRKESKKA